jgi:excisionase family DNA binding protein
MATKVIRSIAAPQVLTVNELADYLRCHSSTIYRLLKHHKIPGFKLGSDWRFNIEAIDKWRAGMEKLIVK